MSGRTLMRRLDKLAPGGGGTHKVCPGCGASLPKYVPWDVEEIQRGAEELRRKYTPEQLREMHAAMTAEAMAEPVVDEPWQRCPGCSQIQPGWEGHCEMHRLLNNPDEMYATDPQELIRLYRQTLHEPPE